MENIMFDYKDLAAQIDLKTSEFIAWFLLGPHKT